MTRHQYEISALVTQKSFCEGSSGNLARRRLFSQATLSYNLHSLELLKNAIQWWFQDFKSGDGGWGWLIQRYWKLKSRVFEGKSSTAVKWHYILILFVEKEIFAIKQTYQLLYPIQ